LSGQSSRRKDIMILGSFSQCKDEDNMKYEVKSSRKVIRQEVDLGHRAML